MTTELRISESALGKFTTCDEQFRLSRLWRRPAVKPGSPQAEGSEAHAILAGTSKSKASSPRVTRLVNSLRKLEEQMELNIVGREVSQTFPIMDGVDAIRIIDAYGYTKDGTPVLIDYKTTGSAKSWESFNNNVPPVVLGWQSSMYLVKPPASVIQPFKEWPRVIYFLVSTSYEPIGVFGVEWSRRREEELMSKIMQVRDMVRSKGYDKRWDRTFGYHCNYCDFIEACYGIENWESGFVRRD